jgi:hypothetical protein
MKVLRPEVQEQPSSRYPLGLVDDVIYEMFNITSNELDLICELSTDEEMGQFILTEKSTFTDIRNALNVRNKYIPHYNKNIKS